MRRLDEIDRYIKEHYKAMTDRAIAEVFGCKTETVKFKRNKKLKLYKYEKKIR